MHRDSLEKWRQVALSFHAVRQELASGDLVTNFEPHDLALLLRLPRSLAVKGVFCFLTHIWNQENPFELSQIQRWDRKHRMAFRDWLEGRVTGEPCHYF